MRRAVLALIACLAAIGAVSTQDQFRTATDLVSVYATVLDDDGRLVPNLSRQDFQIKDDGREQPITLFSNDVQPFSVVVMLDRSGSMAAHYETVRRAARAFVRQMRPEDRARIGSFSSDISIGPADFTNDRQELERILAEDLQEMGSSPVWTAIDRSMTALVPLEGRRVVLVFTDGHDDPQAGQVRTSVEDLLRRTRVNGIMVYAIGFPNEKSGSPSRRSWIDPKNPRGPIWIPIPVPANPVGGRPGVGSIGAGKRYEPPDPGLRELAEVSGGGYFEMDEAQDLSSTFVRVAEELHRQYWLGFVPRKLDGKTHEIDVKVRKRGMDVRARQNYVATVK
jgi:Ca-activated chloride channel family protein